MPGPTNPVRPRGFFGSDVKSILKQEIKTILMSIQITFQEISNFLVLGSSGLVRLIAPIRKKLVNNFQIQFSNRPGRM